MTTNPLPTTYRFTSDPLPSTLLSDLKGLNSLNEQQLVEVFSIARSFLSSQPDQAEQLLAAFSASQHVNEKPLRLLLSSLLYVLSAVLQRNLSADVLTDDLTRLHLTASTAATLSGQYRTAVQQLQAESMRSVLTVNELVDFQWRFGVTAASSEVDRVGQTFLQLTLLLDKGDGGRQNVRMELSLPQFYDFLQQMQSASRQVEKMAQAS